MMNENIVQGKWSQVKGFIQKSWGKLTDDELDQTKGDLSQVAGLIQQKYGEAQESVRNRINTFVKNLGDSKDSKKESQ